MGLHRWLMCFGQRLRGSRPRRKIGADTLKPRRALGKTWEQAPTAFEAAQLIKPPALRGVSDFDGAAHNDAYNSLNLPLPFPDAVQEFKVESSALQAQYGVHASANVNVVTKSGTNDLHGDAFEFVRNGIFNARDFFAPTRDTLKRNQFGGTLGGAIVKNKLFFFGGYQGTV